MSSPNPVTASPPLYTPQRYDDLGRPGATEPNWLWHGYLAPGDFTLLTSQWKTGKTTLLSVLLHQLKAGGVLAGQKVRPGNAVVVSEESPSLWFHRGQRFDYRDHVLWFCRPF